MEEVLSVNLNLKLSTNPELDRGLPKMQQAGFYLFCLDTGFGLKGWPIWLGLDPAAGIRAFHALGQGFYVVFRVAVDHAPPEEWGTLAVWGPPWARERWRLRARDGRPVAVPGAVCWDHLTTLPVAGRAAKKGGLTCEIQN
jgi:hypothetical protein